MTVTLHHGNCLEVIPSLPDCSVDSIVTDPPYELGFMGKKWDASGIAYNITLWQECLRVLKPGGHLLAFGGTRTYHRMACAIEDAGFEIRDSIHWLYGSGFPKSLDVSKAIDKVNGEPDRLLKFTAWMRTTGLKARQIDTITNTNMGGHYLTAKSQPAIPTAAIWEVLRPHCGDVPDWVDELVARIEAEREIIGSVTKGSSPLPNNHDGHWNDGQSDGTFDITAPATEQAKQWAGWGTALKPAHEPIVVARKPLVGTVASNVLEWGTGAINIDASRIGTTDLLPGMGGKQVFDNEVYGKGLGVSSGRSAELGGRWPANVILDDTIANSHDDWPRYFYCAKPSRKERNAGLDHLDEKPFDIGDERPSGTFNERLGNLAPLPRQNHHPTVKPLALMRYLVRLVTPPDGTVLEPFAGSGTTLMACVLEGFHAIGIEMTDEYLPIIEGRVAWAEQEATKQQEELDL